MQERQEPTFAPSSATAAAPAAVRPAPGPSQLPRSRRWLRRVMLAAALCLIAIFAALGLAWWWAGQSDSLGRTLAHVASWMPADQKLEAKEVQGSLRGGGRIGWLRWSSPALQVEINHADIAWSLQPLLQREVRLSKVHMQELRLRSTPQPKDDTPAEPLQSLLLPLRGIEVPVHIERLVWEGPPETVVTDLQARYAYTGSHHELQVSSLNYAQGAYRADVRLQAAAPMELSAELQGTVQAPLPNQPDQHLDVQASAQIQGTLATEAARLQITAQAASAAGHATPLAADITATVRPWLPQPLEQAQAELRHVDAALFMPGGPRTDLNGTVQAGPEGEGWKLNASLNNALPGPWDQQALPLRAVTADLSFDGLHTWLLHSARVDLGKRGDAHLQAQARLDTQTQAVQGQVTLAAIHLAELYSTLDAAPLSGTLQAHTDEAQQVHFQMDLQSPRDRSTSPLRLDAARAQGSWKAPELQLRNVHIDALQAQLRADALLLQTDTQQLRGQAQLQVPGARASLDADASPDAGQGRLQLDITAAQQLGQWLARLPLGGDPLAGASLQGQAQVELAWQGGWAKLQQRLQNPAAPMQASGLTVKAQASAKDLRYTPAQGQTSVLQQLQLSLSGVPENLQVQASAQAQSGTQTVALDTALTAGLLHAQGAAPADWHAQINTLSARWSPTGQADAAWQARLAAPVSASQRTQGSPVRSTRIQTSEGQLHITAPASAGTSNAHAAWEPVLLHQARDGSWAIQTQGRLQEVPLAWVDAFSPDPQQPLLASAGIGGDLIVQGRWDIDTTGRHLRADAVLERASGDIRLSVEDSDAASVTVVRSSGASEVNPESKQVRTRPLVSTRGMRARLQDLRVQVSTQDNALRAQVLWNSERAGQLQADVRSQLQPGTDGLAWPEDAPLSGNLKASMPNIGLWAIFAPPGWRISGSLNADVQLAGTRSAPQWNGQLNADQLGIQSLLDGVDLKDGRLRARLQGTRLDITELFLKGGEGSSTRILGQSGNLTSAPRDGGTLTGSGFVEYDPQAAEGGSGIRMDIRTVADRLQVLIRADRQISISGGLQASMQNGQVTLQGDLKVDRATIMLADASAPALDEDVHIHSAASRKAAQDKAAQQAQEQQKTQAAGTVQAARPPDIRIAIDLGPDFALQGYGITTRLQGQLQVTGGPHITGEIHTVMGRYRAWSQSLDVEQGVIRFSGPYANPAIDIQAIRPNIAVRVGAKVTGSANRPVITLFSEPEMSDAEKLSWLVMGRSASANGAETALLQQAALALLSGDGSGGNFAGQLGLDEVGLKGPSEDGSEDAALTVGKRLSQDLYVAYEQSLSGAMGTLYIFYDLSRRLTLRGQTGEQTAVDLIYTRSKD